MKIHWGNIPEHRYTDPDSGRRVTSLTYNSWLSMMIRCYRPSVDSYRYYGGRGIVVCEDWKDFHNFHRDMGTRPEGYTLDRIDGEGMYTPENTRWSDTHIQNINRKSSTHRTSIYRGVCWHKGRGKWTAQITIQKTVYHLGYYSTELEASEAYNKVYYEWHGVVPPYL